MSEIIRVLYTFHQHIIDVYFHGTPDQIFEDFVNYSMEDSPIILEFKGHHLVVVDSPSSSEGCLVFIWWVHLDLTVVRIGVYEAKELVARCCLH